MSSSSFIFRPGNRLSSDDEFSFYPISTDNPRYPNNHDSDLDQDTKFTEPDLPQHLVVDLEESAKLNIRDQSAQLRLPKVASTVSMDHQQFPLQKLALPLIAEFNKVCPHPGNQFKFFT